MRLYAGIDLHSTNSYLAIVDEEGRRVFHRKIRNEADLVLGNLQPFKEMIEGVAVESTFNADWMVDLLSEEGYLVHLANPSKMQKYSGLKYSDDRHDAFWLAELLRLKILPEGYIYPKQDRPVRDLLRKRAHLVRLRSSLIISLQNILARTVGGRMKTSDVKVLGEDRVAPHFADNEVLGLIGRVSKEAIDVLTRQIDRIERTVDKRLQLRSPYQWLLSIPGVGTVLALTIMLETGPISRFDKVGNYASYCRKVPSIRTSNDKKKGTGNRKCGNQYLAWAFGEAAEHARRYNAQARAFYERKRRQTNVAVAHSALAHKLARAAYYILRDGVTFKTEKAFA